MADGMLRRINRRVFLLAAACVVTLPACVKLSGCAEPMPEVAPATMKVTISGKTYTLELALDDATRTKGLGQRTELAPDAGMLFSFPRSDERYFVMRDCFIPLDIIFLDATGNVTATHHMPIEPPRGEGEGEVGDYLNRAYASRLKRYGSRYAAKYAIEIPGGALEELDVKPGDRIDLDTELLDHFTE
ncbi:MAG: DUF192 domain-containing protein [Phycisphaerales bacterium JB040]